MIIFINFYWLINDWKILCSSFLRLCSNYRQERKTILCVSKLRRLHIKVRSFPFSKIRICESAILYRFINQLCLQYVCTYEYKKTYPICTRIHNNIQYTRPNQLKPYPWRHRKYATIYTQSLHFPISSSTTVFSLPYKCIIDT